jgi:hypothetical protein
VLREISLADLEAAVGGHKSRRRHKHARAKKRQAPRQATRRPVPLPPRRPVFEETVRATPVEVETVQENPWEGWATADPLNPWEAWGR